MADDAELIGGISVSVGADHSKLVSDLAEANRILDQWEQQKRTVQVGATFTGGTGGGGAAARPAAPPPVRVGATARAGAQGQEQTSFQRAINAELAKTGQHYNAVTGEVEDMTAAVGRQRTVIAQVQQQAAEPTKLNIDTEALQNDLKEILALLKAVATEAAAVSQAAPAGGGGGGGGRRRRAAAGGDGDGEEGPAGNRGGRIGILRQPGISEYEGGPFGNQGGRINYIGTPTGAPAFNIQRNLRVVVSPQQRAAEQQARAAAAEQRRIEREARDAEREQRRAFDEPIDNTANNPGSATFAAQHTEASRARAEAENDRRRERTQMMRRRSETERVAAAARDAETAARFNATRAADEDEASGGRRGGGGGGGRGLDPDERERQRIATRSAQSVSTGRTARTGASSFIGGFLFGGQKQLIEAQAALAAANERVVEAQRRVDDPRVIRNATARRHAVEELTVAQNDQAEALKRVESFSTLGAGARNLAAVTVAGAAFGAGLAAISVAGKAAEKALTPYFDQATGYAQKTADLTTALADQARQQQGNAQGVTALKLAQSGFAATTTASIQPLIAQRAQVEAGNKALVEQIETFRIADNLRRSSATAGLGGSGTGGIGGTSLFGIPSTGEQAGNFLQDLAFKANLPTKTGTVPGGGQLFGGNQGQTSQEAIRALLDQGLITQQEYDKSIAGQGAKEREASLDRGVAFINDQLKQGGNAAAQFTKSLDETDPRIERTAQAFEPISKEMADAVRSAHLFSNGIKDSTEAISALQALNLAGTLTGPAEQLRAQQIAAKNAANSVQAIQAEQARQLPGFLASLERRQQIAIGTQLPAQAALQNLAAPLTPVGTGIVGRNAREQDQINASTVETQKLQDTLNKYYAKGYDILRDTYQIPASLLTGPSSIQAIGQAIATTQAGIANEQAQYQVAQINYQLFIAKRTLSDIGGLTGHNFGEGKSYLGVLEGQNLALSRQAQLLQFSMSQRQINFQTAVAGFTVPGLTPAEQNARVTEAKKEAEFAQKQLDIQKQMFRNQVKIVDISNLRQGYDLVRQVGLLLQGRRVTIHTAEAQQKLERLQSIQQKLVAEAGTYITKIDAQIAQRESNMQQIEQATGRAITRLQVQAVDAAFNVGRALFIGMTGGFLGDGGGGGGGGGTGPIPGGAKSGGAHRPTHAAGGIFSTKGTTSLGAYGIAGEAGRETVAIIRNPHALSGTGGGAGATVNFNGDMVFKTEADFQRMYRMVLAALGKDASIKGLRMPF